MTVASPCALIGALGMAGSPACLKLLGVIQFKAERRFLEAPVCSGASDLRGNAALKAEGSIAGQEFDLALTPMV